MEKFPNLKKPNHFPLFTERSLSRMLRILKEQIQFKNNLLNTYQASGLFKD